MSAHGVMNEQQFFRGHAEEHQPGDIIRPNEHGYAYAITSAATASMYGRHSTPRWA
jgi:hypothetical protein